MTRGVVKRILVTFLHWIFLVYSVLIIGTAFVPHVDADHTGFGHLFPIVVGLAGVWVTYQKPEGN